LDRLTEFPETEKVPIMPGVRIPPQMQTHPISAQSSGETQFMTLLTL
jgi:hypothetical protein